MNCPICNKVLTVSLVNKNPHTPRREFQEGSTEDFICDTYQDVAPGIRWCHYQKTTAANTDTYLTAIVGPYQIIWANESILKVDRINPLDMKPVQFAYNTTRLYEVRTTDIKDFLRAIKRFSNLKAFA